MKKFSFAFLSALLLFVLAQPTLAGIRPSFLPEQCSWRATDVVIVTEDKEIDGEFTILETLKGDLKPSQTISVPELAAFKSKEARLVSTWWDEPDKSAAPTYVTGSRMILFLIDARKSAPADDEENPTDESPNSKSANSRWRSANPIGDEVKYSTVWIEKGEVYCFIQVMNPGDSLLVKFGKAEQIFRDEVVSVVTLRASFDHTVINSDVGARAEGLGQFVHSSLYPARDAALKELMKCNQAALPVLRRLLEDESLAEFHGEIVEALAKAGGNNIGPDLVQLLDKELVFWKRVAPSLRAGWWNGAGFDSIEAVEPYRNRYIKAYQALGALKDIRYAGSVGVVRQFRDYWRSMPQLSSGLDQMTEVCDQILHSLDESQINGAPVVYEIRFEGSQAFPTEVLENKFREYLADYAKSNKPYEGGAFDYARDRLFGLFMSRGYWGTRFDSEEYSSDRGTVLSFHVEDGKMCRLGDVNIKGAQLLAASEIRPQLPLNAGDIADGRVIDKWLADLERTYRNRGYLKYEADNDTEIVTNKDGVTNVINLKITITEGKQFKVGSITFHGPSEVSENRLRGALALSVGDLYSEERLLSSLEKLTKLGLDIDREEDVRFSANDDEGLVNIVIVLDRLASKKGLPKDHLLRFQRIFY